MGISVEVNQGYRGIKLALSDAEEAKRVMDFLLPYMDQGLEIKVNVLREEKKEEKEETNGE